MAEQKVPIIRTSGITKEFSGVQVLQKVDFDIYPGEVHALLGENGAGKSTLMKIVCGVYTPTAGEVYMNDQLVDISSPHMARDLGIALIHQEPLTFPDLDVTENIFMGHTRQDNSMFIDWTNMYREARRLLDALGVKLDVRAKVRGMSIADQQMVEIVSALSQNAKIIVMDEPTAAITSEEVKVLFSIIRVLQEQGRAIVFISHRLAEVKEISNRITVLRDGEKVRTCRIDEVSRDDIIQMMIGRSIKEQIQKEQTEIKQTLLSVKDITLAGTFRNVSLEVKSGEIVGLAGLIGAGRSEVARAIFGITPPDTGTIILNNTEAKIKSPRDAVEQGLAYVPEDRAQQGLFLPVRVSTNITFAVPKLISHFGWLKFRKERDVVLESIGKLSIRLRNEKQEVRQLSGGNQQKVVLSKWLLTEPQVLILDEPTRGIDVGAKAEVYQMINNLAKHGKGILMISSELPEILGLCDRIYVMREGRINGHFHRKDASDEKIMEAATGA